LKDVLPQEVVDLLGEYTNSLHSIISEFRKAMKLLNDIRIGEARASFAKVVEIDKRAVKARDQIVVLLEQSRIDPALKEDLFHLVKALDRITDWVKEASRELTIIPYLEVPEAIRRGLERMIDVIVEAVENVVKAVEAAINGDYKTVTELAAKVEQLEEKADEIDVENRGMLVRLHDQIKPCTLALLIHDLNHDLEETADACRNAVDYLRAIVIGWGRM